MREDGNGLPSSSKRRSPRTCVKNLKPCIYDDSVMSSDEPRKSRKRKCKSSDDDVFWSEVDDEDDTEHTQKKVPGYRCSPHLIPELMEKLSEKQRGWVKNIEWDSFQNMIDSRMPKSLVMWLVDKVDTTNGTLDVGGIPVDIRDSVARILKLPCGDIKVPPPLNGRLKAKRAKGDKSCIDHKYSANGRGASAKVETEKLIAEEENEEEFCRSFVMLILCIYAAPTTALNVNRNYLPSLMDISKIRLMDWCGFIADYLIQAIREFRDSKSSHVQVPGCVHILPLMYVDTLIKYGALKFPSNLALPEGVPRTHFIGTQHLYMVSSLDVKSRTKDKIEYGRLMEACSFFSDRQNKSCLQDLRKKQRGNSFYKSTCSVPSSSSKENSKGVEDVTASFFGVMFEEMKEARKELIQDVNERIELFEHNFFNEFNRRFLETFDVSLKRCPTDGHTGQPSVSEATHCEEMNTSNKWKEDLAGPDVESSVLSKLQPQDTVARACISNIQPPAAEEVVTEQCNAQPAEIVGLVPSEPQPQKSLPQASSSTVESHDEVNTLKDHCNELLQDLPSVLSPSQTLVMQSRNSTIERAPTNERVTEQCKDQEAGRTDHMSAPDIVAGYNNVNANQISPTPGPSTVCKEKQTTNEYTGCDQSIIKDNVRIKRSSVGITKKKAYRPGGASRTSATARKPLPILSNSLPLEFDKGSDELADAVSIGAAAVFEATCNQLSDGATVHNIEPLTVVPPGPDMDLYPGSPMFDKSLAVQRHFDCGDMSAYNNPGPTFFDRCHNSPPMTSPEANPKNNSWIPEIREDHPSQIELVSSDQILQRNSLMNNPSHGSSDSLSESSEDLSSSASLKSESAKVSISEEVSSGEDSREHIENAMSLGDINFDSSSSQFNIDYSYPSRDLIVVPEDSPEVAPDDMVLIKPLEKELACGFRFYFGGSAPEKTSRMYKKLKQVENYDPCSTDFGILKMVEVQDAMKTYADHVVNSTAKVSSRVAHIWNENRGRTKIQIKGFHITKGEFVDALKPGGEMSQSLMGLCSVAIMCDWNSKTRVILDQSIVRHLMKDGSVCECEAIAGKLRKHSLSEIEEIFMPMLCDKHWILSIINLHKETVEIYDSLRSVTKGDHPHRLLWENLAHNLGRSLSLAMTKNVHISFFECSYPGKVVQINNKDCGFHVVQTMESYGKEDIVGYSKSKSMLPYRRYLSFILIHHRFNDLNPQREGVPYEIP